MKKITKRQVKTSFYDSENDLLYIKFRKNHYESSAQIYGIIFDLNKEREVIGLEILNASKLFKTSKKFLKNLMHAMIKITIQKLKIIIDIIIESKGKEQKATQSFSNAEYLTPQKFYCEIGA